MQDQSQSPTVGPTCSSTENDSLITGEVLYGDRYNDLYPVVVPPPQSKRSRRRGRQILRFTAADLAAL